MDSLRILIVDDHTKYRNGLRRMLETEEGFKVVGEASAGVEAVNLALRLQPDVTLMDIQLSPPDSEPAQMDGIEATRQIHQAGPQLIILMLTMFESDETVFAALRVGARGFLAKNTPKAEIVRAIRAAASGEAIVGAPMAGRILQYFNQAMPHSYAPALPELSERERALLGLMVQQYTNPEIAQRLGLSEKTIRNYVSTILTKLQVNSRAQAIALARQTGLGR